MDMVCLGELLIDFTPCGVTPEGAALYARNPGGAPANVAVAAARLGLRTAFIGKVGDDLHGRFLRRTLAEAGVNVDGLVLDGRYPTTLAFVELDETGERDFSFVRTGCGDTQLKPDELDETLLRTARVLHLGTLSLTDEPARSATLRALGLAKAAGALVSCDVNYRAALWPSPSAFLAQAETVLSRADLVKVSAEEALLLTGEKDPAAAADRLKARFGLETVAVTLGAEGAYLAGHYPAFSARAVDATGAGDCFWAAYLYARLRERTDPVPFANAAASLCVERPGAIPAMPTLSQVLARLG